MKERFLQVAVRFDELEAVVRRHNKQPLVRAESHAIAAKVERNALVVVWHADHRVVGASLHPFVKIPAMCERWRCDDLSEFSVESAKTRQWPNRTPKMMHAHTDTRGYERKMSHR